MIPRSFFPLIAFAFLVLWSCGAPSKPEERPKRTDVSLGSTEVSTAFDEAAYRKFLASGIAPPRTGASAKGSEVRLDRDRIRDAFATPKPFQGVPSSDDARPGAEGGVASNSGEPASTRRLDASAPSASPASPALEEVVTDHDETDSADELSDGEDRLSAGRARNALSKDAKKSSSNESVPEKLTRIASAPRLGKLLYHGPDGKLVAMTPRALRIVVFMDGLRARTIVDAVFENPADRELEGTFFYSLPVGATPAGFGMFRGTVSAELLSGADGLLPVLGGEASSTLLADVTGRTAARAEWADLQEARVVGQVQARKVYEEIVRQNVDPALLEWGGGNTFRARVFPIAAKSLKRVLLAYEETLPRDGDRLVYGYPLPDETSLGDVALDIWATGTAPELLLNGEPKNVPATSESTGWLRTQWSLPAKGGIVHATQPAGVDGDVLRGDAAPLPGQAFLTRVRPSIPDVTDPLPTGRALFLLDTSLSGDGPWQGLAAETLKQVLANDPTISEYAVMLFDLHPRWLHQGGWRRNDQASRDETSQELDRIYLEGATSFAAVLDTLEETPWVADAKVFLLSDGEITWGADRVPALLKGRSVVTNLRWNCYRYGELSANLELFDALTSASGGRTIHALSADDLPNAALAHRKLPVILNNVSVSGARVEDLVVAGAPRLLYPGQELKVAGRLLSGEGELVLTLGLGAEQTTQRWSLAASKGRFAARAFAELHVNHLLALDDPRLDRMITALSQAFGLANRAASFLVLDSVADYERFDIQAEQVDLRDLATLRAREEDQRRDVLLGIALDGIPQEGLTMIAAAAAGRLSLEGLPPLPSLDLPLAGGEERLANELAYRKARALDALDVRAYVAIAEARALSGDTMGAVRALSCLVEKRPSDAEAARLVGYACLALGQYEDACALFERVRINRPFEPQAFLEEALALEAAGRHANAIRNYEIVLARDFPRHQAECRAVARSQYARLLTGAVAHGGDVVATARLAMLRAENGSEETKALNDETGLQVVMHWNSDSVDIDLWVMEPEGAKVFYSAKTSPAGGTLYWDTTNGYGPELYHRRGQAKGTFEIAANYFGNNSARWHVPTGVLLVVDKAPFSAEGLYTRSFRMSLLPDAQATLSLRTLEL